MRFTVNKFFLFLLKNLGGLVVLASKKPLNVGINSRQYRYVLCTQLIVHTKPY